MATLVDMPKLGVNMTKGTIVRWLIPEGDEVRAGQPLFEVETDKVVQEVEASASGVLAKIITQEEEEVPCTAVIAVITQPGEPLPEEIPTMMPGAEQPKADIEVRVPREEQAVAPGDKARRERKRVPITPLARKLARELGVDTSKIPLTGKRITKKDVQAAHKAEQAAAKIRKPSPVPPRPEPGLAPPAVEEARTTVTVTPWTSVRRTIAERMNLSARTVARVALALEVDATALIAWREKLKRSGNDIGFNELLAKLVAHALQEFPYMNAQLVEDEIRHMMDVNVGIAMDTERGLLVPVIRNANQKGVVQIGREFKALTERARAGKITLDDLAGGTFTITNLGMYEIEEFLPIINVPQCAILGIGAIVSKPVAVDGEIAIRPRMSITLAFDHRLVDGAPGAKFLQRVKHLVENPLELLS